jgi:hypothetical protein
VLSFDARPFPRMETCLLEDRMPCNATERIKMPKRGGELGFTKNLSKL